MLFVCACGRCLKQGAEWVCVIVGKGVRWWEERGRRMSAGLEPGAAQRDGWKDGYTGLRPGVRELRVGDGLT